MSKNIQKTFFISILFIALCAVNTSAQTSLNTFKDFGYKGGFQINGALPTTEFEDDNGLSLSSYLFRGFFRFELSKDWQLEANAGYGKLSGKDWNYTTMKVGTGEYKTSIIPIEARLLFTPLDNPSWNPYFYAGAGLLNYSVGTKPNPVPAKVLEVSESGWSVGLPVGLGAEIKLSDEVALDVAVGYNWTLTDNLNYFSMKGTNDGYITAGIGLSFSNESLNTDKDKDGLTKKEELALGTDPNNPDTDGDGLKDGEEVTTYKTNPVKADTDGDGLNDGDEVMKYKTDPLKADTDGDGLKDGDEVLKYKTDPLKADTDGDGLNDGDEVLKFKTDPLKVDTDGDGLKDGEEVMKYKTDPLKVDTDGGTVGDGIEVKRGSNPLDPKDDVPAAFVEKQMNLENVYFGFDKHNLTKDAMKILDSDYETLSKLTEAKVSLGGHTDAIGSDAYNQKLSVKRANVVKDYLVKKGLSESVIAAEGFGKTKYAAPNKTSKDRAKNRRTEVSVKYMEKAN
jgi:outer membrane protein OmpA-like peptidoglycan-associated protein/opacity protein-like surface antigen